MGIASFTAGRAAFVAALLAAGPGSALAASFHYASSSNRIYVEKGGSATLSDIKAALPNAPLDLVSSSPKVWLLRADLQIIDGTTLVLHGTSLTGGDVDELRIQSNAEDDGGFVRITADYGGIDIDSTRITSWDTSLGAPDEEFLTGRASIRVRSRLDADGVTPLESRMDIANSEIQYLGWNAAESYGLVWKVNGFTGANPELFDQVQVRGNITGSRIHHNYYGVYTFGHQDGVWTGNEVDHNKGYGFDPHDDTDNLLIEDNDVHDNGNHGIIASKRCDHVIVRNNRSYNNHGNGIMLHRSSDDGLVENNEAHDNNDSGVAIFATARAVIRDNTLLNNGKAGIRMSMGTTDSVVTGNEIGGSGQYGFYFYKGSDVPEPGSDGRNKRNLFKSNTVHDIPADGIRMTDGDGNKFVANTFTNVGSRFTFKTSTASELTSNTVPSNVVVTVSGSSEVPSLVTVRTQTTTRVQLNDEFSTMQFRDADNHVFDAQENISTSLSPTSALMTLTRALIGSTSIVIRRPFTAEPSTGKVHVNTTVWATDQREFKADVTDAGASVKFLIGQLTPGARYVVTMGSGTLGTFTANSSGLLGFTASPGTTAVRTFTVSKV